MLSVAEMIRRLKALPRDRKVQIASDQSYAKMICQFHYVSPGQRENTPSFKINLKRNGKFAPGTGRCFGCSQYVGKFEAILDPSKLEISEESFDEEGDDFVQPLYNTSLDPILLDEDEEEFSIPNPIPWTNDEWRSIPGYIMKGIGAQLYFDVEFDNLMVYLPCNVDSKHIGGIRANIEKKGKRNYYNTKGPWVKEEALFPYDYTVGLLESTSLSTIIIVEGPRDSLKLLQYGIPAVAILGTGNWSETKAELILSLHPKRVITALDGDAAGKRATKEIHKSLKNEVDIYNFDFSKYGEDLDPCNCPEKVLRNLKRCLI